jgi:hypothetical protein
MSTLRAYLHRLNAPGHVPGLQLWFLAAVLGLLLGTSFHVDAMTAVLPDASLYAFDLLIMAPAWVYFVGGAGVLTVLVAVLCVRAIRCAPLDTGDWSDSELRTLRDIEDHVQTHRAANRRCTERRAS